MTTPAEAMETEYDHDSESPAADVVRARFTLACGAVFPVFCTPHEYLSPEYYVPTIMTKHCHVALYRHDGWSEQAKASALALLGHEERDVFPIRIVTEVNFDGELVRGFIGDFDKCREDPDHKSI